MEFTYAGDCEYEVAVSRGNQTRARSDERRNVDQVPAIGVNWKHAIALTVEGSVNDLTGNRAGRTHRRDACDAFICGSKPPACRAAARYACDANPVTIHVRKRLQIIDGEYRVKQFNPGGRVASRIPLPPALAE